MHPVEVAAEQDACDMIVAFSNQIINKIISDKKASNNLKDYEGGESYHKSTHLKSFDLTDAAIILDIFSEHKETNEEFWKDLSPIDAVCKMGSHCYANYVLNKWEDLIDTINYQSEEVLDDTTKKYQQELKDIQKEFNSQMLLLKQRSALENVVEIVSQL